MLHAAHFADRYWLHGIVERTYDEEIHRRSNHLLRERTFGWNVQKVRSESDDYVRKTTVFFTNSWRIKIALESFFEEHAQEVWERN